ncbi:hypothetical protein CK203_003174 [Vitis vinifera]|uniref:Uncharacterized protein n=1 Tax=Vitis vinifera TaxID=29760 RepID=A0A438K6V4_VITVI|nr:hypothetical protein CK203_003174 [Vitis vinifera]
MPRVVLLASAHLHNVALLQPEGGRDDEEMNYFLRLKCQQCGWISENEVCVNMAVQEHAPGSSRRNSRVNLSLKCEGYERQGTITLVPGNGRPLRVDDCTNVPLMVFDCNGTFPVYYSFNGGWSAVTNVALLQPEGGSDDEEMNYFFRLKCEQCGWISKNEVCVNLAVQEHGPRSSRRNSRVNLSLKVEGCERQGTITLVPGHARPLRVDDCTTMPQMVFYCNGTFPVYYSFNGGWSAVTPEGGSDDEEMNYFFRNEVCVNMAVQERAPGSSRRNSRVNLSLKCEGCERQGTITLVPGHAHPLRVDDCTNVPLMVFDCNGTFPVYYSFNGGWHFRWFRLFLFLLLCFSFCLLPISAPFVIPSASSISKFGLGVVEAQDSNARELQWTLKCEQCGWISENEECVNMAVQERAPGSSRRNSRVNLSRKCEGCERQGTITLVPGHGRPLRVDDCTNVPLMVFDCNGTFPVYYSFNGGWHFRWFRLFLFLLLCFSFCLLPISAPFVIPSASSISKFGLGVAEAQDSNARELQWTLKCEQCGWISENEECVNMAVQERAPGSSRRNNRVNLSLKCEGCERYGTITLVPGHTCPLRVDDCTNVPLMVFLLQRNLPGALLLQRRMVGRYDVDIPCFLIAGALNSRQLQAA